MYQIRYESRYSCLAGIREARATIAEPTEVRAVSLE